jgi:chemotaxis protein methyltransferase CheR
MNDPYLDKIREFVAQRSRLSFTGHKKGVLRQRLHARIEQLGLTDASTYWQYLMATREEEGRLFDALTTNETFFFRNPDQFQYLGEKIIPALEAARGMEVVRSWGNNGGLPSTKIMKLRVLSAGCSTGEEPYSIAMTLLESIRYPKAWDIEILAGDLSESCLQIARRGIYGPDRLKGIPPGYRQRYLDAVDEGVAIKPEAKEIVSFIHLNLNNVMNGELVPTLSPEFGGFDIIFCRNVMIYFSPACQQLLVDTLYRLLAPGGYLFTGDAEPLHLFVHDFTAVKAAGCLIYQKKSEADNHGDAL